MAGSRATSFPRIRPWSAHKPLENSGAWGSLVPRTSRTTAFDPVSIRSLTSSALYCCGSSPVFSPEPENVDVSPPSGRTAEVCMSAARREQRDRLQHVTVSHRDVCRLALSWRGHDGLILQLTVYRGARRGAARAHLDYDFGRALALRRKGWAVRG